MSMNRFSCCGCAACAACCKKDAISMIQDEEGFVYPKIDLNKCTHCGLCRKICSFKKAQGCRVAIDEPINENVKVYVGRNCNSEIVEKSRSGGVFTALSDVVLREGGGIYGVIVDDNLEVVHTCAHSFEGRDRMRGSKYVQSRLDVPIYRDVLQKAKKGDMILFVGTSCQVAAVKSFISGYDENIFFVDIVCHGVVSPLIYKKYLEYISKENNSRIRTIDFRNKAKYGWKDHVETVFFEDEKSLDTVILRNIFYSLNATRPACSKCPYKSQYHPGDITIADCWGVESVAPEYADNQGCSLIFINTEKGKSLFSRCEGSMNVVQVNMSEDIFQQPLHRAYDICEEKRRKFWNEFLIDSDTIFVKYSKQ